MRVPGGVIGDAPVGVDADEDEEDENDIVFSGSARAERTKGKERAKVGRPAARMIALGAREVSLLS